MPSSSKHIKLHRNVLLEWNYDSENLHNGGYQVIEDISVNQRSFVSSLGTNTINNTIFTIDPVLKKYAKIDPVKYNQFKIENYTTNYVQFDKLRMHLPTNFNFVDNGYIGLHIKIYTYDFDEKKQITFSSFLYDDTDIETENIITLNEEFYYDEQSWGKYISFEIPSINAVSKQRTSSSSNNRPSDNSINLNLTQENGISETSPIFIDFAFITSKQKQLGNTYYYLSELFERSISQVPEYLDLETNIEPATDGDYFWIYGSYAGSNEKLDDFVNELRIKGRSIKIEYEVTLFEENILMSTQTYNVSENFTKKLWYRPILSFTNTTASIDVTMKLIDKVDNSVIERFASTSITKDIFKYGKIITRINIDNAYKPKIYNLKNVSSDQVVDLVSSNIAINKVNYPLISDRIKILTTTSPSNITDYMPMGLGEIIINSVSENVFTFNIAKQINGDEVTPYDLTEQTENSEILLSFQSDSDIYEVSVWKSADNDYKNGIIYFKIPKADIKKLKKIGLENKNFYIIIKSSNTNSRSMLYSGKWIDFKDVEFSSSNSSNSNPVLNVDDFLSSNSISLSKKAQKIELNIPKINLNKNAIIFLDPDSDVKKFEKYLDDLNINIHIKKPSGNNEVLSYFYFILNVTPSIISDIKKQIGVIEIIPLDICIGKGTTNKPNNSLQDMKNKLNDFNCNKMDSKTANLNIKLPPL